jgi:energy-converting hydrogenase Eha subunit A
MHASLRFPRNILMGALLEQFFIAAVVAILSIRFFLTLAGFPQVGGRGLHIAHLLWGGFFMLIAIILLLAFLGRQMQHVAAVLGGIGFGTFIDELGKFITSDNNYFFQPAIALIYGIFVVLFLIFRHLERPTRYSPAELLANALDEMKEIVLHHTPTGHDPRIMAFLHADSQHNPLSAALVEAMQQAEQAPATQRTRITRTAHSIRDFYARLSGTPWLNIALLLVFVAHTLFTLGAALVSIATLPIHDRFGRSDFVHVALVGANGMVVVLLVIGLLMLGRSRASAYRWFKRAIFISLVVTQVLQFYLVQLVGIIGVGVDLLVLSALNGLLAAENQKHAAKS